MVTLLRKSVAEDQCVNTAFLKHEPMPTIHQASPFGPKAMGPPSASTQQAEWLLSVGHFTIAEKPLFSVGRADKAQYPPASLPAILG
jgi:hypothetical protein